MPPSMAVQDQHGDNSSGNERPHLSRRHTSTSSQHSLSETSSSHSHTHTRHPQHHHKAQRHVVGGHGRLGARNTSYGKSLNKLGHLSTQKMPHFDGSAQTVTGLTDAARDRPLHTRHRSGDSSEAGEAASPRPSHAFKRNASAFVVGRNHSHTALKKNHSSGQLARNTSGKALNKLAGHRVPPPRRKHSGRSEKSAVGSPESPVHHEPTVKFALADADSGPDDDDEDNEWTEESASVSPNLTRDHTRNNSTVLDPNMAARREQQEHGRDIASEESEGGRTSIDTAVYAPRMDDESGSSRSRQAQQQEGATKATNGASTSSTRRTAKAPALDADVITSRLLHRNASSTQNMSSMSGGTTLVDDPPYKSVNQSGTPGRDLVSRFVNGNSADGTPRDDQLLAHQDGEMSQSDELTASKRNRSAPNMADRGPVSPMANRSGLLENVMQPRSRTQQKLLLQRASSVIEPQKHLPAVLPRSGAAQLLGHGLSFTSAEGRVSAQAHALFSQINKEYTVVRRYRNPVADAAARQKVIPKPATKDIPPLRNNVNRSIYESPNSSFRDRDEQWHERQHHSPNMRQRPANHAEPVTKKDGHKAHKSRVSFDLPSLRPETPTEEAESPSRATSTRVVPDARNEAYEICRRMWDMHDESEVAG